MKAADIGWVSAPWWNAVMLNDRLEPERQAIRVQIGNQLRPQIDCCSGDAEMVAVEGNEMGASDAVIHAGRKTVLIVQQALDQVAITMPCLSDRQKIAAFQAQGHSNLRKMLRLPGDGGVCPPCIARSKAA